jgi:hypothetical protein
VGPAVSPVQSLPGGGAPRVRGITAVGSGGRAERDNLPSEIVHLPSGLLGSLRGMGVGRWALGCRVSGVGFSAKFRGKDLELAASIRG